MRNLVGAEQRGQIGFTPAAVQHLEGVIGKLAHEDFALDAVPEHIILEAQSRQSGSCRAKAPVRPFTETVHVGVGMADGSKIVTKVYKKAIRNMEMSPSAGVAN